MRQIFGHTFRFLKVFLHLLLGWEEHWGGQKRPTMTLSLRQLRYLSEPLLTQK
jgi:hypothetical protein